VTSRIRRALALVALLGSAVVSQGCLWWLHERHEEREERHERHERAERHDDRHERWERHH
jgi:hypothetical protein